MDEGARYSRLGHVLDDLARKRDVRGPARVARYVRSRMGEGPGPSAWHQIFTGETKQPAATNIELFANAFDLTYEERVRLALVYSFPEPSAVSVA